MPTPDPSVLPQSVWIVNVDGGALDWLKLAIVALVIVGAVLSFAMFGVAGLLMRR